MGVGAGGGPGRTTGIFVSDGPGLVGAPLPPACCSTGAAAGAAGTPAITGAPAGTPASTGAPAGAAAAAGAPRGTGAPTGTGAPRGTGAPAGTGAAAAAAAAGPGRAIGAGAATSATGATGAATPAICCMHVGPPVGSGAADALGVNAKAAPHNPALAVTVMPNRSKIFNAHSPVFGFRGVFRNQRSRAELYRCPETFPI